jgi:hypothetical protein
MALPQQVVEQLSRESEKTPGWSSGILFFSGGILMLVIVAYLGLTFGYQPYLNGGIEQARSQISSLNQSISSADQAKLLAYYSQIANLNTIVVGHVFFSQFLAWLEANTEANVYYGSLDFTSGRQATLATLAKTQADVNQQIAIFESSPDVSAVSVPNVAFSPSAGMWSFGATLTLKPSLFLWQSTSSGAQATTVTTPVIAATTTTLTSTTTTSR